MSDASDADASDVKEGSSIYGQIGWAVFLVIAGTVLVLDDKFPDGTIFISGGVTILIVAAAKKLKGIEVIFIDLFIALALLISGLNDVFELNISFFPIVLILFGFWKLFDLVDKTRKV